MSKDILKLKTVETLFRLNGADRVSVGAKKALQEHLLNIAQNICSKAKMNALHAGRKTLQETDVKLAVKN